MQRQGRPRCEPRIGPCVPALLVGLSLFQPTHTEAQAAGGPVEVVQTEKGLVRGRVRANYTEWLGIPYAAPPVGPLRWRPPEPASVWSGVLDATEPGGRCVQGTGWDPGYERSTLTEDCLYINVYRPHTALDGGPLPVFVWIHGGGLRGGAGYDVDPRKFVTLGNVVFVTFNYRLGATGFLAVPSLSRENRDAAGNYGMLDQQAALQWLHRNVREFGGNPEQVTIAGQSAGASSVCNQLTSPSARGLFVRAIHQSGGCGMVSLTVAEEIGTAFAEALGCSDPEAAAQCLRAKSPADVLAAQNEIGAFSPVYGGDVFPLDPAEAIRTGSFTRVPIIIGQTHDERTQSMFAQRDHVGRPVSPAQFRKEVRERYGTNAGAVLERYPVAAYWSPTIALATVEGDELSCVRRDLIGRFARATPTYAYEFDEQDPPPFVSIWRLNTTFRFGATHVNELGYLFDYLRRALPFSSAQMELSDQMIQYWSSFAWTGNPNADHLAHWPTYTSEMDGVLSLKASGTAMKTDFAEDHKCDLWNPLTQ